MLIHTKKCLQQCYRCWCPLELQKTVSILTASWQETKSPKQYNYTNNTSLTSLQLKKARTGGKCAFVRNNAAREGFAFGKYQKYKVLQHHGKKPKTTITTTSLTAAVQQLKKAGSGAANKLISFTSRHTLGDTLLHFSKTMLQVKGLEREKRP